MVRVGYVHLNTAKNNTTTKYHRCQHHDVLPQRKTSNSDYSYW